MKPLLPPNVCSFLGNKKCQNLVIVTEKIESLENNSCLPKIAPIACQRKFRKLFQLYTLGNCVLFYDREFGPFSLAGFRYILKLDINITEPSYRILLF